MRSLTVEPGIPDSLRLEEFRIPAAERGSVLVRAIALGVCGTDREIIAGKYGAAPPGHKRLIIGHESLGVVEEAPRDSKLLAGDIVVGIVRHPDPVPCANCAVGEWDMCRNGRYTEHGIKSLDGFGSEFWRIEPSFVVPATAALGLAGVLTEPASVVAKAWEHCERIGRRARWNPQSVLITGAGPVGLLAALLGRQRGLDVHVFDLASEGPKPEIARALGAAYYSGSLDSVPGDFDVIIECTGAPSVIAAVLDRSTADGLVCLLGVSGIGGVQSVDLGSLNREVVLDNRVIFGSVNANRRHYEAAITSLANADRDWLHRLITKRVPLESWKDAFVRQPDDIKTVVLFDTKALNSD
ncbi:MAG TPA: glucose 1-dehydrogenase [Gemmatimonadaceae bacterium]